MQRNTIINFFVRLMGAVQLRNTAVDENDELSPMKRGLAILLTLIIGCF